MPPKRAPSRPASGTGKAANKSSKQAEPQLPPPPPPGVTQELWQLVQSGPEKLISRFRTSLDATATPAEPGCTPAEVGRSLPHGSNERVHVWEPALWLRNLRIQRLNPIQVGQMLWQLILPSSEETIAKRQEVLGLGIVPMAIQNLLHANSTVVAPAAGVLTEQLPSCSCCSGTCCIPLFCTELERVLWAQAS